MTNHSEVSDRDLREMIRANEVVYAGNRKLKIYGALHCVSGKRMKKENRVFFSSADEAAREGYRPCGHCQKKAYRKWKEMSELINSSHSVLS